MGMHNSFKRVSSEPQAPSPPQSLPRPYQLRLAVPTRPRVLHLTPFGENFPRFVGRVPGGISHLFFRTNCLLHFQQKGFYDEFLHTWVAPENSFGVNIHMEVPRLDMPANSSLFQSFAFRGLAVRHSRMGITLRKCPFASAVGVHQ